MTADLSAARSILTEMTEKSPHTLYMGIYTTAEANAAILTVLTALDQATRALEPFAREVKNWSDLVPDDHRSLCTEPGSTQAHPGSETEFTLGDLRRAAQVHAQLTNTGTQEAEDA